jgi:hypothetical protein
LNWIYINNSNRIICYRFYSWLPGQQHELSFRVPDELGLTCLQHGSSDESIPSVASESAVESVLNVTVNQEILSQCSVQLPHDCDSSRAVTLSLNGIALPQHSFWEVIDQSYPNPDLIAWTGLELQHLAQLDDYLIISYYRRLS